MTIPGRPQDPTAPGPGHQDRPLDPNRWKILALLGSMQFMLLLDATVVSVALPPIQRDLGFTQEGLSWVLNAYVLSSGGFLLLGGRLADVFGQRRMFMAGMLAFGLGSLAAAAAWNPQILVSARFLQGFGEAFAGPAALGLIAVLFTDPFERIRALAIWGGLAGAGGAAGSMVGGFITTFATWHWLFLINIPITAAAFWGIAVLVRPVHSTAPGTGTGTPGAPRQRQPLDVAGAVTSTAAIGLLMGAMLQAVHDKITSLSVMIPLLAGIASAVAFVFIERRSTHPLIPRGFFSEPVRRASNVLVALGAAVVASYPFTMTIYAQNVLGYTPLDVGLMLLPMIGALGLGLFTGSRLLRTHTIRSLTAISSIAAGGGLVWTSFIQVDSHYLEILPGMILFGFAMGIAVPVLTNGSLFGTTHLNSSLASAIHTAAQQAGSALGLASFAAIATAITMRLIHSGTPADSATTAGFAVALRIAAGLSLVSGLLAFFLLPASRASDDAATAGVRTPHR